MVPRRTRAVTNRPRAVVRTRSAFLTLFVAVACLADFMAGFMARFMAAFWGMDLNLAAFPLEAYSAPRWVTVRGAFPDEVTTLAGFPAGPFDTGCNFTGYLSLAFDTGWRFTGHFFPTGVLAGSIDTGY